MGNGAPKGAGLTTRIVPAHRKPKRGNSMAKQVTCPPCGEVIRGENEDDLVRNVQSHAKQQHNTDLSAEQIRGEMRDSPASA